MPEINFSKIRKIFPDIEKSESADDLRRIAEKLDKAEELEKLMKSDYSTPILDHFRANFAITLSSLFDSVEDHSKLIPLIERLRILTDLYKTYSNAENDAQILRDMVDELIEEI